MRGNVLYFKIETEGKCKSHPHHRAMKKKWNSSQFSIVHCLLVANLVAIVQNLQDKCVFEELTQDFLCVFGQSFLSLFFVGLFMIDVLGGTPENCFKAKQQPFCSLLDKGFFLLVYLL